MGALLESSHSMSDFWEVIVHNFTILWIQKWPAQLLQCNWDLCYIWNKYTAYDLKMRKKKTHFHCRFAKYSFFEFTQNTLSCYHQNFYAIYGSWVFFLIQNPIVCIFYFYLRSFRSLAEIETVLDSSSSARTTWERQGPRPRPHRFSPLPSQESSTVDKWPQQTVECQHRCGLIWQQRWRGVRMGYDDWKKKKKKNHVWPPEPTHNGSCWTTSGKFGFSKHATVFAYKKLPYITPAPIISNQPPPQVTELRVRLREDKQDWTWGPSTLIFDLLHFKKKKKRETCLGKSERSAISAAAFCVANRKPPLA